MSQGFYLQNDEFQKLDQLVGELPTRYGLPLVKFFELIGAKRQAEAQQAASLAQQSKDGQEVADTIAKAMQATPSVPASTKVDDEDETFSDTVDVNGSDTNGETSESSEPVVTEKKRKRRTKAEIEAEKAAKESKASSPEPTTDPVVETDDWD